MQMDLGAKNRTSVDKIQTMQKDLLPRMGLLYIKL